MQLGMIGLGKMGANMRERLRKAGHEVVGFDLNPEVRDVDSLETLVEALDAPRVVWVMVPHGEPTQQTVDQLGELLAAQPGRTASSALGDSDRRGSDTVTPVTHGRAELPRIHSSTVHHAAPVVVALAVLRKRGYCLSVRGWPRLGAVDSCW